MKYKILFIICILFLLFPSYLLCDGFSSPLGPGEKEKDKILGILLGFGQNIQYGISYVNCKECEFNDGLGFGYTFGFTYENQIAIEEDMTFWSKIFYGAMLHISNRSISASYREIKQQSFPEYNISFPITFRQINETSIMNVGLMPYINYYPMKYIFVRFGLDGSFIFNANSKHTMELLDRRKTLPNGEIVDIYIPMNNNSNRKTYSIVLQDSEIEDLNKFQFGLVPMIGGNIYFNDKFMCSPSFSYYIPLQKLGTSSDLSISSWRLNIEFRYNITTDSRTYRTNNKPKVIRKSLK